MRLIMHARILPGCIAICLLTILTAACGDNTLDSDKDQPLYEITRYQTATASLIPTQDQSQIAPSIVPSASPTPFIYKIAANDTLIGIATRFNIALEELITANPGLDPNFLIIDTEILIPAGDGSIALELPSPTPVAVTTQSPRCYPTGTGGLWCFLLVINSQAFAVENLAADILLVSAEGDVLAKQQAIPLLNILPAGRSTILVTLFESPLPNWEMAEAQFLSAISIPENDARYLKAEIQNLQIDISSTGDMANISGSLLLASDAENANLVWVLAIAYDQDGVPVAVRRWEYARELQPGNSTYFSMDIFSLGGKITTVEILYEVRSQ